MNTFKSVPSTKRRIAGFGWRPDTPDARDHLYALKANIFVKLPTSVDLRPKFKFPVYDQGRIGSCTANAIAAAIQFDRLKAKPQQKPNITPSRLFIYYNERALEGSINFDAGAQIRDGIKTAAKEGVCFESDWPYDDTPATKDGDAWPVGAKPTLKPNPACYAKAKHFQILSYQRLANTLQQMRGCLAEGFPFVFGFSVYSSIYDVQGQPAAKIPLPNLAKDKQIGGHAVLAVGYDDAAQHFIVRNSWGDQVQDKGHFYIPYAYLTDSSLADDFWVIRTVEA